MSLLFTYAAAFSLLFSASNLSITNCSSCGVGVTGGPCDYRQTRLQAHCCSGHVRRQHSTMGDTHCQPPLTPPPPQSILVRRPLLFIWLQIAFFPPSSSSTSSLLLLLLQQSWGGCEITFAALEGFTKYWFDLENSASSPSATGSDGNTSCDWTQDGLFSIGFCRRDEFPECFSFGGRLVCLVVSSVLVLLFCSIFHLKVSYGFTFKSKTKMFLN